MNLPAESTLATIGLESILRAEPRYTVEMAEQAARVPNRIKRDLNAFLTADDFDPVSALPAFDYDEANELLTASGTPEQVVALQEAIGDPTLAAGVTDAATNAINYLNAQLPRRVRTTLVGDEVVPPSPGDKARFARAWSVVADPMIVLRDLREGKLSRDMVATLAAVYPALYEVIRSLVAERLIAQKAKRKGWVPASRQDQRLRVLMQVEGDDSALATIQAMYAEPPAQPAQKPRTANLNVDTEALQTPGQRSGA
jgi:hypothetical protein